jgi:hypothetical protein
MAIQQELKPQTPSPPPSQSEEELDEFYEDEPRPRSWGAIASVVLALALVFVGYQWNQAAGRERLLASQVTALRADAEGLRLRADEAQRYVDGLQRRVTAISTEKEALAERLATLEKSAQQRAVAARETSRVRATPVAAKKTR